MDITSIAIIVGVVLLFIVLTGLVLGRLYRRATREMSLVKTGAGGKRVIMDGGTIVVPLLHEVSPVNMKTLRLEVQRTGEGALITRDRVLEVADQDRQIIIAEKSEEESRARASADTARAEATKAQESIETARSVATAEREKQIALIEAEREAEREATKIRLAAQAEKDAAKDRAEARREEAQADADAITIRALAKKADLLAEAEGRRAIVEAENAISEGIVGMKVDLARLEALPQVVAEMVKPAEKIDSIKIHQVTGMGGGGTGGDGGGKAPVNQALDSILGMAVQLPALKKLGEELGVSLESGLASVGGTLLNGEDAPATDAPEAGTEDAATG